MIEIGLNKITKSFGFGNIFKEISFEVHTGEITALIGNNGSGKSAILKMIKGIEKPTSGTITIRNGASIGYLGQIEEPLKEDKIVKDYLYEGLKDIIEIENRLNKYEKEMQGKTGKELDKIIRKYTNTQEEFMNKGGYEINEKVNEFVNKFKIGHLLDLNYNNLSGGEKRLVHFTSLMISNPDILLLDEPTNHLDIDTLEWLEKYLKNYKGIILMVSHDRYFMDKVVKKIILLDRGNIDIYFGNYSYYLEENDRRIMLEFKNYNDQQKIIKHMKESIKKLREYGKLAYPVGEMFFRRANSIEKRLEKMEKLDEPQTKSNLPLNFNMVERSGKDVITIKNLNINFGDKQIINNGSMNVYYKDHIALVGKNGSGKSTLIKTIINGNDSIKVSSSAKIGYIPQEIVFEDDLTVYDVARKAYNGDESHLRSSLVKFMFVSDSIFKKVSKLSGGEKVRLKLFCLMQENINLLILDEPTNHIDINTREILEDTLNDYEGTILFVSHDRYFINKVANKVVEIKDHTLHEYIGNYDDYKRE